MIAGAQALGPVHPCSAMLDRACPSVVPQPSYDPIMDGVRRAAEVLGLFSVERPHWGPTDVAGELGVAKSSAYALLRELGRGGLLERLPCGRYQLGWRLVHLAATRLLSNGHPTVLAAARQLAGQLGQTVHVGGLDRDRVVYVASFVPEGGVPVPAAPVLAELTPLGSVLSRPTRGVQVGPQRALDGVTCAATALRVGDEPAGSLAVCSWNARFGARGDAYVRALRAVQRQVARGVRL